MKQERKLKKPKVESKIELEPKNDRNMLIDYFKSQNIPEGQEWKYRDPPFQNNMDSKEQARWTKQKDCEVLPIPPSFITKELYRAVTS